MMSHKCLKCGRGNYKETSIHDDWDGILHCDTCGEAEYRHVTKESLKAYLNNKSSVQYCMFNALGVE